jgi:hypothetical protein
VRPVQVREDSEHLAEDGLARLHEVLGEPAPLAHPVLPRFSHRGAEGGVVGVGDTGRVCGENGVIVNLAGDVPLDKRQVLVGRDLNGLIPRVEPGKGVVPIQLINSPGHGTRQTHPPADILEHRLAWQMEEPSSSLS